MIAPRGWRVSPDDHPERGYFYRSDHFSFAKAGVPSVSIGAELARISAAAGTAVPALVGNVLPWDDRVLPAAHALIHALLDFPAPT